MRQTDTKGLTSTGLVADTEAEFDLLYPSFSDCLLFGVPGNASKAEVESMIELNSMASGLLDQTVKVDTYCDAVAELAGIDPCWWLEILPN